MKNDSADTHGNLSTLNPQRELARSCNRSAYNTLSPKPYTLNQ